VPGAIAAFERLHPAVALDLVVAEVDEALDGLRTGATDVAVVVEPPDPAHRVLDGLVSSHLLTDPFRVVMPRSHRLAQRRSVELSALATERWIGVTSCPGYCQQVVDDACVSAGFQPRYALEADEYPTAQGFVAAGLGVALIPMLALGTSAHPGIAVRKVKDQHPERQVWAVTRPAIADQALVQTMLACLHDSAAAFEAQAS